ncbi:MAG: alpha/beta hydrolase [Alphaproteobacteria bacterium]
MTRKKIIDYLIVALLVYLGSLAYLYFNQRNMIYFPDTARPVNVPGVKDAEVTTKDGLTLHGWYLPPQGNKPIVVLFHGNAGNYSHRIWKALPMHEQGYGVVLAEYRGYGGNPGRPDKDGLFNDGRAWMEFAAAQKRPVVIYGESIGTAVATAMAVENHPAGLILESPFSTLADVAQAVYKIVPVNLLLKDRYDSAALITNIRAPKLFIHGDMDRTVPLRFGRKLYDAAPEPKQFALVEGAGHNDLYDHGAALHITRFLSTIEANNRDQPKDQSCPAMPP